MFPQGGEDPVAYPFDVDVVDGGVGDDFAGVGVDAHVSDVDDAAFGGVVVEGGGDAFEEVRRHPFGDSFPRSVVPLPGQAKVVLSGGVQRARFAGDAAHKHLAVDCGGDRHRHEAFHRQQPWSPHVRVHHLADVGEKLGMLGEEVVEEAGGCFHGGGGEVAVRCSQPSPQLWGSGHVDSRDKVRNHWAPVVGST